MTLLPLGVVSKRLGSRGPKPLLFPAGPRWSGEVCASTTLPPGGEGALRSCGLKRGVSALETFSASSFWRLWCQCMRVLRAPIRFRPLFDMAPISGPGTRRISAELGNYCRVHG
ncbi:MAG: hypothetical protein ABS59_01580 [Methylobacterium sp. SCN 67-24]|nr:MAG: hypothetical protein ABS59_01580 [Methylobacterium sp. SCN 67-24]